MISMGALAARVNGLESEVILLQEKNKELHQLMEDRSDFMNMQLLFLGSFAECTMELNAEKERKKSQNPFRVQAGRAFVLSNDEMIDLVARGEVTRLAKEDSHMAQKATKAVKSANKTKLDAWKAAKDQAWAVAKLDNEAALAQWELEWVIAHESGTTVPLKPILVSQVELWKMADGKDEGQVDSSDSKFLGHQSDDEGGKDEQDE